MILRHIQVKLFVNQKISIPFDAEIIDIVESERFGPILVYAVDGMDAFEDMADRHIFQSGMFLDEVKVVINPGESVRYIGKLRRSSTGDIMFFESRILRELESAEDSNTGQPETSVSTPSEKTAKSGKSSK